MKKSFLLSVFCGLLLAAGALADDPMINITAPIGTVFVSSFPFTTNVALQISHPSGELKNLNVFKCRGFQNQPGFHAVRVPNGGHWKPVRQ